jgi:hypothetical protein
VDSEGSGTDSEDDEEGQDDHKLQKIQRAIMLWQPVAVVITVQYEWNGRCEKVPFQGIIHSTEASENIIQLLQAAYLAIKKQAKHFGGTRMP